MNLQYTYCELLPALVTGNMEEESTDPCMEEVKTKRQGESESEHLRRRENRIHSREKQAAGLGQLRTRADTA